MASQLSGIARKRKQDLRQLKVYSRKLDAAQENLEREINRLINRKRSIPELSDYTRLGEMANAVDMATTSFVQALASMGTTWTFL